MYSLKTFNKKNFKSLKEFKKYHRYTNRQLAAVLGISESYVSHYFTGRRTFGKKIALRISKKIGIPLESLLI